MATGGVQEARVGHCKGYTRNMKLIFFWILQYILQKNERMQWNNFLTHLNTFALT